MPFWIAGGVAAAYALFVAARLGLHQRIPLAWRAISIEAIPDQAAKKYGDRILFTSDTPVTWDVPALRERYTDPSSWSGPRISATAGYLAGMLRDQLGVKGGDRVAILKTNHLDIHFFNSAVIRAGGIGCPINGNFAADKLRPYLVNIGSEILISDTPTLTRVLSEGADLSSIKKIVVADHTGSRLGDLLSSTHPHIELIWLEEALARVKEPKRALPRDASEPLYLVHTSGTTGFPKAVLLRNGPQSHAVRGWLCYVHLSRTRDKGYVAVPNNHQAVILTFNSSLLFGLRVHWTEAYAREGFDAERVIRELADGKFTGFFGFPVTYTQLKEVPLEKYDLGAMRFWASTGDASHEVIQRRFAAVGGAFRSAGIPITGSVYLDAQGSSEVGTPSVIRYVTPFTRRFGRRIGRPGSTPFGPAVRVTKSTGELAGPGETGRLEVKGKTVFDAYWNDHILTQRAFRSGWFFTGDVAYREADGNFIQLDREVDVIHTKCADVYTLPIEETIHKHPAIFDACVYGERQLDGTTLPAAALSLRTGFQLSAEALQRELNEMLSTLERLHRVDILPWTEFPMGVTGKTLKRVFSESTEPSRVEQQNSGLSVAEGSRH